jgi:MoxR-like ATPase
MGDDKNSWFIFKGSKDKQTINEFPEAPPWRQKKSNKNRYVPAKDSKELEIVNAGIYLKRPILVTGKPGLGKSSLAYAIADELDLELVKWEIGTKTVLNDGLYSYDAIARLQDASLQSKEDIDISKYLFLGPLGYAFSVEDKPVVLLIDEIDKSDIDLPNDLLHIFEEMEFTIKQLEIADKDGTGIDIYPTHKKDKSIKIKNGKVSLKEPKNFPIIIMTSNDEREFPPAFLRRCLRLDMQKPDKDRLLDIVSSHFDKDKEEIKSDKTVDSILEEFLKLRDEDDLTLSTDQLLNAMQLLFGSKTIDILEYPQLKDTLFKSLE